MKSTVRLMAPVLVMLGWVVSPGLASAQPTMTQPVQMRDGVSLMTDVYLPIGWGENPVLLIRTPYGRSNAQADGNAWRAAGVAVVVQDLRGRGGSGGVDCVFLCDGTGALQDGVDTLDWIDLQTWSNGNVVTYGGSALGVVQYVLAPAAHPTHRAMWASVATPSFYDHAFFYGGVFREHMVTNWLTAQGSTFFLTDVAAHPLADSFWDVVQTGDQYGDVQVPTVHQGGWYDIFGQGTIDAFIGYQHQGGPGANGQQKLIMGPWVHGAPQTQAGELTYPASALDPPHGLETLKALWFNHYLGIALDQTALDAVPAVQYYVMGDVDNADAPGNEWREADDWPIPAAPMRYYLHAGGDLSTDCPGEGSEASSYTYDPADPSPTAGGANLYLPAGSYDQAAVEARGDVLVFSTPPLTAPVEITGRVRARLWVSIDTVDTDVMMRLTDVYPDGRSMLVLDGAARLASRGVNDALTLLTPGELVEVTVDLWSTSIILDAGHQLRISVTSSNWPRFRASPNDGTSYGEIGTGSPPPVNVTLYHDAEHLSFLEAPDPNREVAEVNLCQPTPTVDAGVPGDASGSTDASVVPAPDGGGDPGNQDSGCACTGTPGSRGFPTGLLLALWGALAVRRRLR